MLEGTNKWQRQPTQPLEFDPNSQFAPWLKSLAVLVRGEWMECGPHGGCAPFTRAGTLSNTYAEAPSGFGAVARNGEALQLATQSSTSGDGYLYDYGLTLIPGTVTALTMFSLGYSTAANTTTKVVASWGDSVGVSARMVYGDGAANNARLAQFVQTGGTSQRGMAVNTANVVDFLSSGKTLASASAPDGYVNGVVSSGATANFTNVLTRNIQIVGIGRNPHSTTASNPGGCAMAGLFDIQFTAEQHAELWRNPWQLVQPRRARIYSFPSPNAAPTISSTSDTNTLIDEAIFVITGTAMASATAVTFKQTNRPNYDATAFITANDATSVTLTGLDVQDMSMAYGAATVSVTTAGGTSADFAITIAPQAAHTHITLASLDAGVTWLGLASADGDQRLAATTTAKGGTFAFVGVDGNYTITYGGAAPTNDSIYWAEFDDSADQWYEATVGINPAVAGGGVARSVTGSIVRSLLRTA